MKAEEGFDVGNLFYGMKTAEWVDHAKGSPTAGVTDSEDDNTIRAGVSMMPSRYNDNASTSAEDDMIHDEGFCDNKTDDTEKFEDVSADFLALGYDLSQVQTFDLPSAYRRIRGACVAREPFRRLDNDNPPIDGTVIGSGSAQRFPVVGENVETMEGIIEPDGLVSKGLTDGEPPTDLSLIHI